MTRSSALFLVQKRDASRAYIMRFGANEHPARGDVFQDNRTRPDICTCANRDIAKDQGSCTNDRAVLNLWMTVRACVVEMGLRC